MGAEESDIKFSLSLRSHRYLCSRRQELFSEECYEDTVHVATDAEDELSAS